MRSARRNKLLMLSITLLLPAGAAGTIATAEELPPPPLEFTQGVLSPAPTSGISGVRNEDAEPGVGVAGDGTLWAGSNILPFAATDQRTDTSGLLSGSDVWKSTDGGFTWQWVADPFETVATKWGFGGEDTDLTVAPEKNPKGFYNVYVTSLWVGSSSLAVSSDGGATWVTSPVAGAPVQDRAWLAADGACTVYMSYHQVAPTYDTMVDKYDTCTTGAPVLLGTASALDPTDPEVFLGGAVPALGNRHGKLVVDNSPASPYRGRVYQPMDLCRDDLDPAAPEVAILGCATEAEIVVAVSTDGGTTYRDVTVTKTGSTTVYIWPVTAAVDAAGNVYVAWFDNGVGYLNISKDGGDTWSPSIVLNDTGSAAYPTVAAGKAGEVFVAWYGTPETGDPNDVAVMGRPNTAGAAQWQVYAARSSDYGQTWRRGNVSGVIHTGVLCTFGGGCGTYPGDRNLLDDFGVIVSPTTGLATIIYSNDQPGGQQGKVHTDFAQELPPPAEAG